MPSYPDRSHRDSWETSMAAIRAISSRSRMASDSWETCCISSSIRGSDGAKLFIGSVVQGVCRDFGFWIQWFKRFYNRVKLIKYGEAD